MEELTLEQTRILIRALEDKYIKDGKSNMFYSPKELLEASQVYENLKRHRDDLMFEENDKILS